MIRAAHSDLRNRGGAGPSCPPCSSAGSSAAPARTGPRRTSSTPARPTTRCAPARRLRGALRAALRAPLGRRLRRPAAARARPPARAARDRRGAARALRPPARRRVPGHQPDPDRARRGPGRAAHAAVRRRRRVPVDLRLPGRRPDRASVASASAMAEREADNALVLPLSGSFRSDPEIVAAVNAVGDAAARRLRAAAGRAASARNPAAGPAGPAVELLLTRAKGWGKAEEGTRIATARQDATQSRVAEARFLAERLRELADEGVDPGRDDRAAARVHPRRRLRRGARAGGPRPARDRRARILVGAAGGRRARPARLRGQSARRHGAARGPRLARVRREPRRALDAAPDRGRRSPPVAGPRRPLRRAAGGRGRTRRGRARAPARRRRSGRSASRSAIGSGSAAFTPASSRCASAPRSCPWTRSSRRPSRPSTTTCRRCSPTTAPGAPRTCASWSGSRPSTRLTTGATCAASSTTPPERAAFSDREAEAATIERGARRRPRDDRARRQGARVRDRGRRRPGPPALRRRPASRAPARLRGRGGGGRRRRGAAARPGRASPRPGGRDLDRHGGLLGAERECRGRRGRGVGAARLRRREPRSATADPQRDLRRQGPGGLREAATLRAAPSAACSRPSASRRWTARR